MVKMRYVRGGKEITPVSVEIEPSGWRMTEKKPFICWWSVRVVRTAILVLNIKTEELFNFKVFDGRGDVSLRVVRENGKYVIHTFSLGGR